jgi:phage/plasmid-like protein (TIGR03299 family)
MNAPITNSRFLLPASDVATLREALAPAYRVAPPAAQAEGPAYTTQGARFGSTGHFVEAADGASFESIAQTLRAAQLAWPVDAGRVIDDRGREVDGVRVVRRLDTGAHLGVVSASYAPVSAVDAFGALLGPAVAAGAVKPTRAGIINARAFLQASVALDAAEIVPGDVVVPMLTGVHSWDAKSATKAGFTPVRIVCKNTLAMAAKDLGSTGFSVHKRGTDAAVRAKMHAVGAQLNQIATQFQAMVKAWRFLAGRSITTKDIGPLVERIFEIHGDPARLRKLTATIDELAAGGRGTRTPGVRGTAWGIFNAFSEYNEHESTVRGALPEGDRRWERVLTGDVATFNTKAQEEILVAVGGVSREVAKRAAVDPSALP